MYFVLFSFTICSAAVLAKPFFLLQPRSVAIPGFDYAGCFTEATFGRALTGKMLYDDSMTTEKCAATCAGFTWFGTEYGRECYCGQALNDGSKKAPEITCSYACKGDTTQKCGGENRLTAYAVTGTASPYQVAPVVYKALGCYAEPPGTRALNGGSYTDDNMTVAKCQANCDGFAYFGLEYSRECFCGSDLADGTIKAPETDCLLPCKGDITQTCGGPLRLNLYSSTGEGITPTPPQTTYLRQGCYTDKTTTRALTGRVFYDDSMTVEKCSTNCQGFGYFGLEYGRECYCGNTINASGQPAIDSDCNFACPGNNTQKCGAGDRLDVYKFDISSSTTTSLTTSTISSVVPSISSITLTTPSTTISPVDSTTLVSTSTESSTTDPVSTTTSSSTTVSTTSESTTTAESSNSSITPSTSATTTSDATTTTTDSSTTEQSLTTTTTTESSTTTTSTTSDPTTSTTSDLVTSSTRESETALTTSTTSNQLTTITTSSTSETSTSSTTTSTTSTTTTSPSAIPTECVLAPHGNLISNPSFEDSEGETISSWTRTVFNGDNFFLASNQVSSVGDFAITSALCGNNALVYRTAGSTVGRIEQRIFQNIVAGQKYNVSAYTNRAHLSNGMCHVYIYVTDTDLQGLLNLNAIVTGDGWQKLSGIYTATETDLVLQIIAICSTKEDVFFDQVVVEPTVI